MKRGALSISLPNCLYYTVMNGQGACRRFPPIPVEVAMEERRSVNGLFPPVAPSIWCGEHQPQRAGMAS